jgi:ABC-2 type transport system ATP-binding protein
MWWKLRTVQLAGGIEGLANIERLPQGMTVFLTAHNIEDAERMCDRMDFIVGGRIGVNGICRCVVIR